MKSQKIKVLDVEYTINFLEERNKLMIDNEYEGYCDYTSKKIYIYTRDVMAENPTYSVTQLLFHELFHAFLFECGIGLGYGLHKEEYVDFLACQYTKINSLMIDGMKVFESYNDHEAD